MPGNSPGEAVEKFLGPIKHALSCLGDCVLVYRDHPPLDVEQVASLNAGEGIRVDAVGHYEPSIRIELELSYEAVHCPDDLSRGPYRCTSTGYILVMSHEDADLVAFHWHPRQKTSPELLPHFHIGERRVPQHDRLHIPTPRVSVEEFIAIAIESFGVQPTVDAETWRQVLDSTFGPHVDWRTWSERGDAPTDPSG